MKFSLGTFALIACLETVIAQTSLPLCNTLGPHNELPCEQDVESAEFVATPAPTASPTASPTPSPTSSPSIAPTAAPTSLPTALPSASPTTAAPTDAPSDSPSDAPSDSPSEAPSSSPSSSECTTTSGVFGDIDQEVSLLIEYDYELEASVSAAEIESDIIPLVESAVTDSILSEIFSDCEGERRLQRSLRVSRRRLQVTGVTQNPEDEVLTDVVCGNVESGNECVVVSGALSIFATDEESANAMQDAIKAAIKDNMDNGDFDDVSEDVVRVSYTELNSNVAGSQGADRSNTQVGNNNTGVLVGALVAAGVVVAAVGTIAYKRRNRAQGLDEGATSTFFGGDQPTSSS